MAREKKISINTFDEAYGEHEDSSIVTWNGLEISVKKSIPYESFVAGCMAISNACFGEDGAYIPEAKDVSIRMFMIAMYTNLSLPLNLEKRYDMACFSGVFETILPAISGYQYEQIIDSVNERIRIRTDSAVDAVIRQANSVAETVQGLSEKFEEKFASLLGDITPEEMSSAIRMISQGRVDEEKIVEAYRGSVTRTAPEREV